MCAEEWVYERLKENQVDFPYPKNLVIDTKREYLDRDYMLIEYIRRSDVQLYTKDSRGANIIWTDWKSDKKLHSITGSHFGYISEQLQKKSFRTWEEFLDDMCKMR